MAATRWIRENAALAAGIFLPVAVVVFFLLAAWIPRLLVDPPRYDFLFAGEDYVYAGKQPRRRFQIDVDAQQKLRVRVFAAERDEYAPRYRLFRYEHAHGSVREIDLPLPAAGNIPADGLPVDIAELRNAVIDSRRTAPDGYALAAPRRRIGFPMLLYQSSRLAFGKNGAVFTLPPIEELNWDSVWFLGWIDVSENR